MRCIIAGSRYAKHYSHVVDAVKASDFSISVVISGGAKGADSLGEAWAIKNHKTLEIFPADWGKYGYAAGPIRNRQMASKAEALIALWDGKSRGTKNMIEEAIKKNLQVYIHRIEKDWYVSFNKLTFRITTVDNIITDIAPVGKKFLGQHMIKLLNWMKKQGGLKINDIK